MQINLNDPDAVLWLQQSLARVVLGHCYVEPSGEFDALTRKAVGNFQTQNGLPVTGEPDAGTVTLILEELAMLDTQPIKKKRRPPRPTGSPGDPVI